MLTVLAGLLNFRSLINIIFLKNIDRIMDAIIVENTAINIIALSPAPTLTNILILIVFLVNNFSYFRKYFSLFLYHVFVNLGPPIPNFSYLSISL